MSDFLFLRQTRDELEILLLRMVAQLENIARFWEIIYTWERPTSVPVCSLSLEYNIHLVPPRLQNPTAVPFLDCLNTENTGRYIFPLPAFTPLYDTPQQEQHNNQYKRQNCRKYNTPKCRRIIHRPHLLSLCIQPPEFIIYFRQ